MIETIRRDEAKEIIRRKLWKEMPADFRVELSPVIAEILCEIDELRRYEVEV